MYMYINIKIKKIKSAAQSTTVEWCSHGATEVNMGVPQQFTYPWWCNFFHFRHARTRQITHNLLKIAVECFLCFQDLADCRSELKWLSQIAIHVHFIFMITFKKFSLLSARCLLKCLGQEIIYNKLTAHNCLLKHVSKWQDTCLSRGSVLNNKITHSSISATNGKKNWFGQENDKSHKSALLVISFTIGWLIVVEYILYVSINQVIIWGGNLDCYRLFNCSLMYSTFFSNIFNLVNTENL